MSGALYLHVLAAPNAAMEAVLTARNHNGIVLAQELAHIPAIHLQAVSHHVLINAHIPDRANAMETE